MLNVLGYVNTFEENCYLPARTPWYQHHWVHTDTLHNICCCYYQIETTVLKQAQMIAALFQRLFVAPGSAWYRTISWTNAEFFSIWINLTIGRNFSQMSAETHTVNYFAPVPTCHLPVYSPKYHYFSDIHLLTSFDLYFMHPNKFYHFAFDTQYVTWNRHTVLLYRGDTSLWIFLGAPLTINGAPEISRVALTGMVVFCYIGLILSLLRDFPLHLPISLCGHFAGIWAIQWGNECYGENYDHYQTTTKHRQSRTVWMYIFKYYINETIVFLV